MIVQKSTTVIFLGHNQSGPGESVQVCDLAIVAFCVHANCYELNLLNRSTSEIDGLLSIIEKGNETKYNKSGLISARSLTHSVVHLCQVGPD